MRQAAYKRVLLKFSGEALMGDGEYGISPSFIQRLASEVHEIVSLGDQVALVVGGGNIFRGAGLAAKGMDRVTADHMGMLATVMNALALQDALEQEGVFTRVMSAIKINQVCEDYIRRRAIRHLEKGRVVVFAAGTGNPFFTTDSAASLRAIEINADVVLKATKVDASAERYQRLTYDEVLERKLEVMDATAIVLCRDHSMPIIVFDVTQPGALVDVVCGKEIGTIVEG